MLPELPTFDPKKVGARMGNTLNRIFDRIQRQTLIGSKTVKITDTEKGTRLDRIGGVATASALSLGFAVTHTGSDVLVAAGKVLTQGWTGTAAGDFRPGNWTEESNFVGATLSSTATEVWIKVTFSESDTTSEGLLALTAYALNGMAGGVGGGGAGGGASRGDSTTYSTSGTVGEDGADGGAGGAGGDVRLNSDNSVVIGVGTGSGEDGGAGGDGGDGGAGSTVTFTRATKGKVKVRYYTLTNITAHTVQGASSETTAWVQIATISGIDVVQHHIGNLRFTPAAPTFVPL